MPLSKDYEFSSERLRFRGIAEEDAELIVEWRSNPENYRNFFNARPITLEEHLAWFGRYLDDSSRYDFMVIDSDGRRIGTVGLSRIGEPHGSCEISYMIGDVSARGKGYASEAVRALTDVAFSELDVASVDARIVAGNDASCRVVLAAGYAEVEQVFRVQRGALPWRACS